MKKDNKTLVILSPGFPKDETDTACLPFLQDFVREINAQFPLLTLIILPFDYPFTNAPYQWSQNDVIPFNGWKKRNVRKLLKWLSIWTRLKKIQRSYEIIGILSLWCGECAFLGKRFANRNHLAHFCWIQGQDAKKENKYIGRIKPSPSELIALSDFNQNEFEKNHGIRPGHVIPAGIRPAGSSVKNAERDIDILGAGSLIPLKQYHLFIEIVYHLKKSFPSIKVVLSGKGPEEASLKLLIVKYDLQENIRLTGELAHEEILGIMHRSKVFLHTSNYEGLGIVCIEALSAGCRVISFIRPMSYDIEHWTIAQSKEEMIQKAGLILRKNDAVYEPVLPFTSGETVNKILQLFHYNEWMMP